MITLDAILVEQVSAVDATWVLSGVLGVNLVLFISCLICMFHLLYQKGLRLKLFFFLAIELLAFFWCSYNDSIFIYIRDCPQLK